jgi:hypothetical protein
MPRAAAPAGVGAADDAGGAGVAAVPDGAATPTADAAGGEVWTHVMSMSTKCQRNGMIDVSRGELDLRHHVPCFM